MKYRICDICDHEYDPNEHYCPYCGAETPGWHKNPNLRRCPDCGNLISKSAKSCPNCGFSGYRETDGYGKTALVILGVILLIIGLVLLIGLPTCRITVIPLK